MIATHLRSAEMTENPHVDHILKREKPADLPVQLVINLQNRQGALPDHAAYLGDLRIDQRIAFVRIRW
jgi:hypothetical protein